MIAFQLRLDGEVFFFVLCIQPSLGLHMFGHFCLCRWAR